MKYQVGDRVKIKSFDWFRNGACIGFSTLMSKYCGEVLTIQSKNNTNDYRMKEDGGQFYWTDDMIEGLASRIGEGTRSFAKGQQSHTKPSSELYEEYMEEKNKLGTAFNPLEPKSNANCITRERVDELATKIDKELPSGNQYVWELPDGYQFVDENGNVINATKIALEKKKTEYPKTYEECVSILGLGVLKELKHYNHLNILYRIDLIASLQKLIICRDAYWKVSGREYDFDYDLDEALYYIYTDEYGDIVKSNDLKGRNCMLGFPTAEAQEAFYENFRTELEICKELL